ncbi:MAG TPA: divalent-cation tolerance protein CutA [Dehalococcoidia bacterium]|nr:divalent-cation tolerance protein CutA [Dehalococcoidia bacterium]
MESGRDVVVVLVTTPAGAASEVAQAIVRHKLAACVNIASGVQSIFWWQGEVQEEAEALLVAKTTSDLVQPLNDLLAAIHPYENFELIAIPVVAGSAAYLEWVAASSGPAAP